VDLIVPLVLVLVLVEVDLAPTKTMLLGGVELLLLLVAGATLLVSSSASAARLKTEARVRRVRSFFIRMRFVFY
jgi:hypothetical protein